MLEQQHGAASRRRPGRMTSVMRAAAGSAEQKALRIAVVEAGRVVDERLVKERVDVTVGPSERATFVIASRALPKTHALFSTSGDAYSIELLEGMTARVALDDGIRPLSGQQTVSLSDSSRGKVVIGETTLLFQFVHLPPPQPKPQLPLSVRKSALGDIDWITTIVAAFSFLIHFFGVAMVYSDWADPIVNDDRFVSDLIDKAQQLPPPPPLERPRADSAPDADAKPSPDAEATAPKKAPKGSDKPRDGAREAPDARADADAKAAEIASELAALDMQVIVGLGDGVSTNEVMGDSEIPTNMLDDVAGSAAGARNADPLRIGESRDTDRVRPGEPGGRLADIGRGRSGLDPDQAATAAASAQAPEGPRGGTRVGPPQPGGGRVPNAQRVVARMRGPFRHCYQRGLEDHPTMQGSVTLVATIGPNGEVRGVGGGGGALTPIVPCLKGVVRSGNFGEPEGGGAVLGIPINFFLQR